MSQEFFLPNFHHQNLVLFNLTWKLVIYVLLDEQKEVGIYVQRNADCLSFKTRGQYCQVVADVIHKLLSISDGGLLGRD